MVGSMLAGTKETPGEVFSGKADKNIKSTEGWHRPTRKMPGGERLQLQREFLLPFRLGAVLGLSSKILLAVFVVACLIQVHTAWKSFEVKHLLSSKQAQDN